MGGGGLTDENTSILLTAQLRLALRGRGPGSQQHCTSLQFPNYFKTVTIDVENRLDSLIEKSKNLTQS